jgi:hypothetical protein
LKTDSEIHLGTKEPAAMIRKFSKREEDLFQRITEIIQWGCAHVDCRMNSAMVNAY